MALIHSFYRARIEASSRSLAAFAGLVYSWSGVAIMWAFWICFVIFLANPARLASFWPLPMVDRGGMGDHPLAAAAVDVLLISLFGLQHSVMARPWFKALWSSRVPSVFERCTFVHMANIALFALIIFWQPITMEIWSIPRGVNQDAVWVLFAIGWIILFAGARSFGILDLLGVDQMHNWAAGLPPPERRLKTGMLYGWLRHPMYVGVLIGVWATPHMTAGHLLLAAGLTLYVLIGMRYEERDLARNYGSAYRRWRMQVDLDGKSLFDTVPRQ